MNSAQIIPSMLSRMIAYFGTDTRRVNHTLKVFGFAQALSGHLDEKSRRILLLAAILHDIGIKNAQLKYHSSAGNYQELEGPPVAREMLGAEGLPPEETERICYLIGHHHTYSAIDGTDYQILIEADFLVNIFEDGLGPDAARTIREKHFRTPGGRAVISRLYGL